MEIKTRTLGTITIEAEQVITLKDGFFGFPQYHDFALIDAEQKPFIYVQSTEDESLSFIAIDPFVFRPDYELDINDDTLGEIGVKNPDEVLVFALVTIPSEGAPITANLQGPLVINKTNKQAMQAVLSDSRWKTKHDILAEMNGGSSC